MFYFWASKMSSNTHMRKYQIFALFLLCSIALMSTSACSQKSGCPAQESLKPKVNRKGEIVATRNKHQQGLFPKKMQRRMK
jgi:hypothetical protein